MAHAFHALQIVRLVIVISVSLIAASPNAFWQVVYLDHRCQRYNFWYWWGPTDPLAQQIHAHADFQRALGESAIDFAETRKINADTFRKEIDNSVAYIQAGWDKKAISRAENFKRCIAPLDEERLQKSKQWDWL